MFDLYSNGICNMFAFFNVVNEQYIMVKTIKKEVKWLFQMTMIDISITRASYN